MAKKKGKKSVNIKLKKDVSFFDVMKTAMDDADENVERNQSPERFVFPDQLIFATREAAAQQLEALKPTLVGSRFREKDTGKIHTAHECSVEQSPSDPAQFEIVVSMEREVNSREGMYLSFIRIHFISL